MGHGDAQPQVDQPLQVKQPFTGPHSSTTE